ncbi:MAG: hypothetical protein M3519_06995, partial [Actinomycetota bacterium]|nr:hypothetical protein [Actinomycetota bacterium]
MGIDLVDKKQMVVVTDHDSRVLARRTLRCRAWELGAALDWAGQHATGHGFMGVRVVTCFSVNVAFGAVDQTIWGPG